MSTQRQSGGVLDAIEPVQGALYGGAAFVAGYVLTYVLLLIDSEIELDGEEYLFETVGMVFYNAQFVDAEQSLAGETETINILSENSTQIPELGYTLVPVCLLLVAGYVVARRAAGAATTAETAAKTGVSVVVGYLPLVFVGTIVFEVSEDAMNQTFSVAPQTGNALLVAGLVLPIVLGAVGGFLSRQ